MKPYILIIACVVFGCFSCSETSDRDEPWSDPELTEYDVVVSQYGELSGWCQSNSFDFDSIAIHGPIDSSDMSAIANTGRLRVVNLDKAIAENGYIPDRAFNINDDRNPVRLSKIIFPGNTVEIGENVLNNETVDILLPTTLRTLHEQAFSDAVLLNPKPLIIPEGVTEIPEYCFSECHSLSEVILPSTIRSIGNSAFYRVGLRNINFPPNLEKIGSLAFSYTGLHAAILPNNCMEIGFSAFSPSHELHTLILPEKLKVIPSQFAAMAYNLSHIEIPASVELIKPYAFSDVSNIRKVIFKEGLTEIERGAFELCMLKDISLPSTIKKLGDKVFTIHDNLEFIRIKAPEPPACEENTFCLSPRHGSDDSWNVPVFIPAGSSVLYKNAVGWKNFRNFIEE